MAFNLPVNKNSIQASDFQGFKPHKRRVSELRSDLVTGSWVVLAPARLKRPHEFRARSVGSERTAKAVCPFENPQKSGNGDPILIRGDLKQWSLQVVSNKYPAFSMGGECIEGGQCSANCGHAISVGPYSMRDGYGFHEVLITRSHDDYFAKFSEKKATDVVGAYLERYLYLQKQKCIQYIAIFENHGHAAGASLYHPHAQIIAMPFIPQDVKNSLDGSKKFYAKYRKCAHCEILKFEQNRSMRVIYKKNGFIAVCPFASFGNFEVRIYPTAHQPSFNEMSAKQVSALASALKTSLTKLDRALKNPPYNYFIHTVPIGRASNYKHYHWHIEILPAFERAAGLELGTGVQILTISPEQAAHVLNKGHF